LLEILTNHVTSQAQKVYLNEQAIFNTFVTDTG